MSNRWKIVGLCCVDPEVLRTVNEKRPEIRNLPFNEGIAVMDQMLFGLGCPLGNLEAQDMYDLFRNGEAWDIIGKISGKFSKDVVDSKFSEYCMAIGLAAVDRGVEGRIEPLRIRLSKGAVAAAGQIGLNLDQDMGTRIEDGLKNDGVMANMALFGEFWDEPGSTISVSNRQDYPRLKRFPPGWSKVTG